MKVIVFGGPIGVGKTTVIENIINKLVDTTSLTEDDILVSKEPVEEWVASGILQDYYNNPNQHGFEFQITTFTTRILMIENDLIDYKNKHDGKLPKLLLLERSIYDDRYIFIEMLYKEGILNQRQYNNYCNWWNIISRCNPVRINKIIILNADIDKLMTRVINRNRESENNIKKIYQEKLIDQHKLFYNNNELCHNIDANDSIDKTIKNILDIIIPLLKQ